MNKKEIKILENLAESSDFHDPAKQNGIEFFLDGQKKLLSGFSLIPVSFFFFFFFFKSPGGGSLVFLPTSRGTDNFVSAKRLPPTST
jgi:xanthine dehydrogenase molybdopterin-binding subunit B